MATIISTVLASSRSSVGNQIRQKSNPLFGMHVPTPAEVSKHDVRRGLFQNAPAMFVWDRPFFRLMHGIDAYDDRPWKNAVCSSYRSGIRMFQFLAPSPQLTIRTGMIGPFSTNSPIDLRRRPRLFLRLFQGQGTPLRRGSGAFQTRRDGIDG